MYVKEDGIGLGRGGGGWRWGRLAIQEVLAVRLVYAGTQMKPRGKLIKTLEDIGQTQSAITAPPNQYQQRPQGGVAGLFLLKVTVPLDNTFEGRANESEGPW